MVFKLICLSWKSTCGSPGLLDATAQPRNSMLRLFLAAAVALAASYLFTRLKYMRGRQYAHIPQLPNHLLWGHLKVFGEFMSRGIYDRHPGKL